VRNKGRRESPDETSGQGNGAETEPVILTPRRIDLSSLRDVRLELAAVYRKMDSGEIESQEGTGRAYVLKIIQEVIVHAELERRLIELEERHAQRGGAGEPMRLN
jgi:hypothetical protein